MNHKDKLLEIYNLSFSLNDINNIDDEIKKYIELIGEKINSQKSVYTVLLTLITHKIINPSQDIRYHQDSLPNGFSGRTIDNKYISPTLKELGLFSNAESGWLTRSLEQPYPYTLDYGGKIRNKKVKEAFLKIIDYVEKNNSTTTNLLRLLLFQAIDFKKNNLIQISPLDNPEKLTIEKIISALDEHFKTKYNIQGGSKLPVLAFFAIYKTLINEIERYKDCKLAELGSHTASDRTSKTAGDIEIFKHEILFEAIEIKLDKIIDSTIVRVAIDKITRYNPNRYYILSYCGVLENDKLEITNLIDNLKLEHGCQIIINGLLPTIKYYLRLISSLDEFIVNYNSLVENDNEIKKIHKEKWNELIEKHLK